MITSIFCYPGAKSSSPAREAIRRAFPSTYTELREPFVGGGSTFFSTPMTTRRWINDLNPPLIAVYAALKERPAEFIAACRRLASDDPKVMRQHFDRLLWDDAADPALRYLLLNRCSFNGRVRLDDPYRHRTYFSKPNGMAIVTRGDKLLRAAELLRDATVTCADFEVLFDRPGNDVVVFADPPYVRDTELCQSAKLYEKGFTLADHHRLKRCVDRCKHKVVLTYDDHPLIRDLYRGYNMESASWTYKGNASRPIGKELFVSNFPLAIATDKAA